MNIENVRILRGLMIREDDMTGWELLNEMIEALGIINIKSGSGSC